MHKASESMMKICSRMWALLAMSHLGLGGVRTEKRKSVLGLYSPHSSPHLLLLLNTGSPVPISPLSAQSRTAGSSRVRSQTHKIVSKC